MRFCGPTLSPIRPFSAGISDREPSPLAMATHSPFEFPALLDRHGVRYVIIGGHALNVHAAPRATEDIDIVWQRSAESERSLAAALAEANAFWISNDQDPATGLERLVPVSPAYVGAEHLMMLLTDYGFVDLFDYIPGFPSENTRELFDTSIEVSGRRYASVQWLRKMKQASGRPKDLLDLEKLP